MFLTTDQVEQVQELCERIADSRTRSGRLTIVITNNMPRTLEVEMPVYDADHVLIGGTKQIIRVVLPEDEIRKNRQKNRLKPNGGKGERTGKV